MAQTDKISDADEKIRSIQLIQTFPPGETVHAMYAKKGRIFVATSKGAYWSLYEVLDGRTITVSVTPRSP